MSDPPSEGASPLVLALLEEILRDRDRGVVQKLEVYQARFPGRDDLVEHHYRRLVGDVAGRKNETDGSPPTRVGPYRLVRELGRGGQGVVYLAEDETLGRAVALKMLTGLWLVSDEGRRRFRREAETASRLDDPGICTIYDSGTSDGVPYIAMRYVPGETLATRIRRALDAGRTSGSPSAVRAGTPPDPAASAGSAPPSRLELMETVALVERVSRSLHAAHELGVIHRDIKPANIMIDPSDNPVILDFGLARDLDRDGTTLTRTGDFFGTPATMAPEQLGAFQGHADRRTDVYALGVTLFEAVTLRRPFEAPTRERLFQKILNEPAPDARALNRAVPDDLRVVLETALEKDPDARYQTALDLAEDLRRVREHQPIRARPVGTATRLLRWVQRNPILALSVSVTALAVVIAAVISAAFALRASRHLSEWERLADGRRLEDLIREAREDLWPVVPSRVTDYDAWLARARALVARLPGHLAVLESLREKALPCTPADAHRDRDAHVAENDRIEEIAMRLRHLGTGGEGLRAERDEVEREVVQLESVDRPTMDDRRALKRRQERLAQIETSLADLESGRADVPDLERERDELRKRISVRRTWRFTDPAEQLRHDKLRELTEGLMLLQGPATPPTRITVASVLTRRTFAVQLGESLHGDDGGAWERCVANVGRADGPYAGLQLEPIPGLVPLGRDRDSGLWEFWHRASGGRPQWDGAAADVGAVALDAESGREGIVLVLVPGGAFVMGARHRGPDVSLGADNVDDLALAEELPAHRVTLDPFLVSKYEVSQAQWMRTGEDNPSYLRANFSSPVGAPITSRHPVTNVTWREAREVGRRWDLELPTEAQWEFACRAGTTTPFHTGGEVGSLQGFANIGDATRTRAYSIELQDGIDDEWSDSSPVGALRANAFGLYDVHGNAAEWCLDTFFRYQDLEPAAGDGRRGPVSSPKDRVCRPGSYMIPAFFCRSSARGHAAPEYRGMSTGFRLARSLRPPG